MLARLKRRYGSRELIAVVTVAVFGTAIGLPLFAVFGSALAEGPGLFQSATDLLSSQAVQVVLLRTLELGTIAATIATISATCLAWLLLRTNLPARRVIRALVLVPFLIPVIVTAFGWSLLVAPESGPANALLRLARVSVRVDFFNLPGMGLVLGIALIPIAYLLVNESVARVPAEQEEAAMTFGASIWQTTVSVTLPMMWNSIASVFLVVFAIALSNFTVVAIFGIRSRADVISTLIYVNENNYPPERRHTAILASLLVVAILALLFLQQKIDRSARTAVERGNRPEPLIWDLGRFKWVSLLIVAVYIVVVLLPVAMIVLAALLPYWGAPISSIGFQNFATVLSEPTFSASAINTLVLAGVGATTTTVLGAGIAYMVVRLRVPGSSVIDALASSPLAMPGIVLGLGFLWLFAGGPLYGTLVLVIVALCIRFLPFALRTTVSSLARVPLSFDEAGRVAGATDMKIARDIVLPVLRGEMVSVWVLMFIIFSHEVDTNVLLQGTSNAVLAVQLYSWWSNGELGLAAAAGLALLVMIAVVFGGSVLVLRLVRPRFAI